MSATIVNVCEATDCAYNKEKQCHALAITVGSPSAATCDTYMPQAKKGGSEMTVANVGACKVADCTHNKDLMCHAEKIRIGIEASQVSCLTYSPAG